jgi:cytochrome P450
VTDSEQLVDYPIPPVEAIEPPPDWERMRQQCPVAHVRLPSGDQATLLTRYDDVKQVLADPRFTRTAEDAARVSESGGVFNSEMANSLPQAGDAHQRWRRRIP